MNGVLIIDKPKGWTSHDVVARVRKVLIIKKAGHGGTLDPLATGVLPVYLNEGTKLVPFNLEGTKDYRATMKLGQETDTLDADGKVVGEKQGFPARGKRSRKSWNDSGGPYGKLPRSFRQSSRMAFPSTNGRELDRRPVAERETP